jgi:hypothetical protein
MIVTEAQRLRIKLQPPEIMSAWFAGEGHREKNYGPNERDEYLSYRVMDFLRLVLTASAVVHFAREESSGPEPNSVIILVGEMIFNGILKTQDGYVFRQHDTGPLWGAKRLVFAKLRKVTSSDGLRSTSWRSSGTQ